MYTILAFLSAIGLNGEICELFIHGSHLKTFYIALSSGTKISIEWLSSTYAPVPLKNCLTGVSLAMLKGHNIVFIEITKILMHLR